MNKHKTCCKKRTNTFWIVFLGRLTCYAIASSVIDYNDDAIISEAKQTVENAGANHRDCFAKTETIETIYINFGECIGLLDDFERFENDGPAVKNQQTTVYKAANKLRNILQITKNTADNQKSKNTETEFEGKEMDVYSPMSLTGGDFPSQEYLTEKHQNFPSDTLAGSSGTNYNRKLGECIEFLADFDQFESDGPAVKYQQALVYKAANTLRKILQITKNTADNQKSKNTYTESESKEIDVYVPIPPVYTQGYLTEQQPIFFSETLADIISEAKRTVENAGAEHRDCFCKTETIETVYSNLDECIGLLDDFYRFESDGPAVKYQQTLVSKAANTLRNILQITENTADNQKSKNTHTEFGKEIDVYVPIVPVSAQDHQTEIQPNFFSETLADIISEAKRTVENAGADHRDCFTETETIETIYINFDECIWLLDDFNRFESNGPAVKYQQTLVHKAANTLRKILQITKNTADNQKSKKTVTEFEDKETDVYAPIPPIYTQDYLTEKQPNFFSDTFAAILSEAKRNVENALKTHDSANTLRNILQITKNTVDQQKSKNTGTEFEGKELDAYAPISPVSTVRSFVSGEMYHMGISGF